MLCVAMVLAAVVLLYVFVLRARLAAMPAFAPWFERLDAIERRLWRSSRTILVSRLYWLAGLAIALHDLAVPILVQSGFDWQSFVPPEYAKFSGLALVATGMLFEQLRKVTAEPVAPKGGDA